MKTFHQIIGMWVALMALSHAQVSTFPTPPPLSPPGSASNPGGSSSGQKVAPYPGDNEESSIQNPGAVAAGNSPSPTASFAAATLNSMAALDDKTKLQVGDSLSFRVIEDRDQAVPLVVADSGEVNFPYINRVKVVGKSCHQVAVEVKKLLEVDYYKRATVIVGLDLSPNIDKTRAKDLAWVVGEVRQVGPYELVPAQPMTVSQIILRSGGFGDFADQRKVKVMHRSAKAEESATTPTVDLNNTKDATVVDVKSVFEGKSTVDPLVKPGDYIIVPRQIVHFY